MNVAEPMNDHVFRKFGQAVNANLAPEILVKHALKLGEGKLTADGALSVTTGVHTGRSPHDKFIVRDSITQDAVWWENNAAMSSQQFQRLFDDMRAYARDKTLFLQDLDAGADAAHRIPVRVATELAWHSLFIRHLLIKPAPGAARDVTSQLTIINLPGFKANPARHGCRSETVIACDFTRRIVLIAGTEYAGEMKKAVFTYLNFVLTEKDILPMHCAANVGKDGDVALFFGLSGTGKTTLSADPSRTLVGDDEHGWSEHGIFNFEGGCYAKTFRLSEQGEPEIFAASKRPGAVLENVIVPDSTGKPDFDDASLTENGRAAYPLEFIANASATGQAGHVKTIVLLTCDAFGVLPPLSKLTPEQAVEQFLAGYTAKISGTERGVTEPQAVFSACFGAPFMPRPPEVYGELLKRKIVAHGAACWLVNTGWTGGPYGLGQRMPLAATRRLLRSVLDNSLDAVSFRTDPLFGFAVPEKVPGVTNAILDPRQTWNDTAQFDIVAKELLGLFAANRAARYTHAVK